MKVQSPKNLINSVINLSSLGRVTIPKDGIIEVPDGIGQSLVQNFNFTEVIEEKEEQQEIVVESENIVEEQPVEKVEEKTPTKKKKSKK